MWQWAQEKAGIFGRHGCIAMIAVVALHLLLFLVLDHFLKHTGAAWLAPLIPSLSGFLFAWFSDGDRHVIQAIRDRLNVQFEGRLLPTCWKCGYKFDGMDENARRCPECGHEEIRGNPTKEAVRRDRFRT